MAVLKTTSPSPRTGAPRAAPTNARPSSSTSAACGLCLRARGLRPALAGNDPRLVHSVVFGDEDLDPLRVRGGHVLAHVVRPDGKLAMPPVDEHRQLNGPRPAEVHQGVHRRARRAAVMDHVVDEHDHLPVDGRHLGGATMRRFAEVAVVAVSGHVQASGRHDTALQLGQDHSESPRQDVSLADDADEHDIVRAAIPLHDLVRDARQRAADLFGVHHRCFEPSLRDAHERSRSSRAMRTGRPLRAWRKYAARGSSSTSGAISSTRGSGCITMAYLRIRASELLSMRYTPCTASYAAGSENRSFWMRVMYTTSTSGRTASRSSVSTQGTWCSSRCAFRSGRMPTVGGATNQSLMSLNLLSR